MDPRLQRLLDAVLVVAGDLDLETVLGRIADSARALVGAHYAALGVIGDAGGLEAFVHRGVDQATADAIGDLPQGRGILGLLIDEPSPLRLDDLTTHPRSYGFPPNHPPMHAFLGAPVVVRGEAFGNLYLAEKVGGGGFTSEDEELVIGLATIAGAAIENARLYDDLQHRDRWRRAVLEVSTTVMSGATLETVRERIAALATELVDAEAAGVIVEHADGLWVLACVGDGPPKGFLPAVGGPAVLALREGAIGGVEDGPVFPGRHSLWVPLRQAEDLVAALGVARRRPFSGADRDLLAEFADQVTLALTHERAQAELQRLSLIEDRERIGRDLHDTVIQRLFATGLSLQAAIRRADDRPDLAERLDRAVDEIDETVKEIRASIFALQSHTTSGPAGVRAAVLEVVDEIGDLLPRAPRVRFEGPIDSVVSPPVAEHLVPVVREALTNVAKHAGATVIELELAVDQGGLQLRVTDDGSGIDPDAPHGFGLANLRDRAEALGGQLRVESGRDGRGTALIWRVPGPGRP